SDEAACGVNSISFGALSSLRRCRLVIESMGQVFMQDGDMGESRAKSNGQMQRNLFRSLA
ncbi:MAG: hypothetical protein ACKO65_07680, partial [Betaproteobacteria bacterium]